MYQSYLPMAKLAAQVVAGLGISKIVSDIVANNVVIASTTQKVAVKVGTFVLGGMLWDQSTNYIENSVNSATTWLEERNNEEETETETETK